MNRLFRAAMVAAILPIGLASVGCAHKSGSDLWIRRLWCGCAGDGGGLGACYRNWVDVSWPDRYNYAARQSVVAPFAQQAATGHFLNQTIWNFYFEPGSDKLTPAEWKSWTHSPMRRPALTRGFTSSTAHDLGSDARKHGQGWRPAERPGRPAGRDGSALHGDPVRSARWSTRCSSTTLRRRWFTAASLGNAFRGQTRATSAASPAGSINVEQCRRQRERPAARHRRQHHR